MVTSLPILVILALLLTSCG